MSVVLFEGHLICYFYVMVDHSSFAQVQVAAYKQVSPFVWQFSGLFLFWFGPLLDALEVQDLQDPSPLEFVIGFLRRLCQEDYCWHLVGGDNLPNHSLCKDFHRMGA